MAVTRLGRYLVGASLAAGVAAAALGASLHAAELQRALPLGRDHLLHVMLYAGVGVVLFALVARLWPHRLATAFGLAAAAAVVVLHGTLAAIAVAALSLAFLRLGSWTLSILPPAERDETLTPGVEFVVGMAIVVFCMNVIARFPVASPATAGLAVAALAGHYLYQKLPLWLAARPADAASPGSELGSWIAIATGGLVLGLGFAHTVIASWPEANVDVLQMHLEVARRIAEEGYWPLRPTDRAYSLQPQGGAYQFSLAFLLGGEAATRLLQWCFALVAALLIYQGLATRVSRAAGFGAVALFLSLPLTFLETSANLIELQLSLYPLAGWLILCSRRISPENGLVLLCCLLAAAVSTKTQGLIIAFTLGLIALGGYLVRERSFLGRLGARQIVAFLVFLVVGFLPYAYSYAITGNPVFPFLNDLFQSEFYATTKFVHPYEAGHFLLNIWAYTFESSRFMESHPGVMGFTLLLWAISTPFLLIADRRFAWVSAALFVAVGASIAFQTTQNLRYIFFVYAFCCMLLSAAIFTALGSLRRDGLRAVLPSAVALALVLALVVANLGMARAAFGLWPVDLASRWRASDLGEVAHVRYSPRRLLAVYRELAESGDRIALLGAPYSADVTTDYITSGWHYPDFWNELLQARSEDGMLGLIQRHGVTFFLVRWGHPNTSILFGRHGGAFARYTEVVATEGTSVLLRVRPEAFAASNLLRNARFAKGLNRWAHLGDVTTDGKRQALIGRDGILEQTVRVDPQTTDFVFLYAGLRCETDYATGRLQFVQRDDQGVQIDTLVRLFPCPAGAEPSLRRSVALDPRAAKLTVRFRQAGPSREGSRFALRDVLLVPRSRRPRQ